jgi:transcriptional regulator of acetoin/glycerol metabolism
MRELENVISCACLTSVSEFIDVDDLPENLQKPAAQIGRAGDSWRPLPLEEIRRQHIRRVLEACEGNRVRAAQMLGIGRTSLYRFLKRAEKKSVNSVAL